MSYIRHAVISGYDLVKQRDSGEQVEVWRTVILSEGPSNDLRRAMPVFMGAAAEHMATSSGQRLSVRLYDNEAIVRAVRGRSWRMAWVSGKRRNRAITCCCSLSGIRSEVA